MALRIFDPETVAKQQARQSFADDVVGRFRSGYQINGRPAALSAWRVTTGDPEVAEAIHGLLGGDPAQEWEAQGEDNLEIFTQAATVDIVIDGPKALRQKMVLRNRNGQIIRAGDGEVLDYPEDQVGQPDPQAGQTFAERKQAARDGIGAQPEVSITFRLADSPELGLFRFQSGSWGLVSDLAFFGVEEALEKIDGPARAVLGLEEVSYTAKSGPQKGKKVSYTKPTLRIKGKA